MNGEVKQEHTKIRNEAVVANTEAFFELLVDVRNGTRNNATIFVVLPASHGICFP